MAKSYLDKEGLLYFLQKIRPDSTPLMDGTASTGTAKRFALQDHVHPSDTSKAPTASPAFTGTPTAPTAATGTSTTQIATTEFVANTVGAMTSGVADVQIDNTSIVTSGIAKIPTASTSAKGLMTSADKTRLNTLYGTSVTVDDWDNISSNAASYTFENYGSTKTAVVLGAGARGAANGVAPLNASSKIDATYLPSYVDDVIEAYPRSGATALSSSWLSTTSGGSALTPETGKIYVLMADSGDYAANTQFRWGGTAYVKLSDGGVSAITNAEIDTIVAS